MIVRVNWDRVKTEAFAREKVFVLPGSPPGDAEGVRVVVRRETQDPRVNYPSMFSLSLSIHREGRKAGLAEPNGEEDDSHDSVSSDDD